MATCGGKRGIVRSEAVVQCIVVAAVVESEKFDIILRKGGIEDAKHFTFLRIGNLALLG